MKNLNSNIPIYIQDSLVSYAGWSFFVHFLVAIAIIFLPKILDLGRDTPKITKIVSAIRVDIVAMPKHTILELKKLSSQGTAGREVKISSKDSGPKYLKKGKGKSLKDLLKGEASKDLTIKGKKGKKSGVKKGKYNKELGKLILQGNKVSKGWAIVGDTREMVLDEFGKYVAVLPDFVRPNWKLPAHLIKKDLNCRIQIYIGQKGELKKAKLFKSSGNREYDKKAMEAVRETSFPIPSNKVKERAKEGQILLGFPL